MLYDDSLHDPGQTCFKVVLGSTPAGKGLPPLTSKKSHPTNCLSCAHDCPESVWTIGWSSHAKHVLLKRVWGLLSEARRPHVAEAEEVADDVETTAVEVDAPPAGQSPPSHWHAALLHAASQKPFPRNQSTHPGAQVSAHMSETISCFDYKT